MQKDCPDCGANAIPFADLKRDSTAGMGLRCANWCGWRQTYGDLENTIDALRRPALPVLSDSHALAVHDGLKAFRGHNVKRSTEAFFEPHSWSPTDWACALAGEVGELCNLIKKMRRGESVTTADLASECADVLTYLDLLAFVLSIDLGPALTQKFDEVSERYGCAVKFEDGLLPRAPAKRPGHVG